jgi:hypothetical protein
MSTNLQSKQEEQYKIRTQKIEAYEQQKQKIR